MIQMIIGKDKGKTGKVLQVFPKEKELLVEKLNIVKRHTRPTKDLPQGGIHEKEAPIPYNKALLFCNKCKKGVRIAVEIGKKGEKFRKCKKCGEKIGKSAL